MTIRVAKQSVEAEYFSRTRVRKNEKRRDRAAEQNVLAEHWLTRGSRRSKHSEWAKLQQSWGEMNRVYTELWAFRKAEASMAAIGDKAW